MSTSRLLAPLSVLVLAPVSMFMLSGCVYREHTVREEPVPAEGYYDSEHHRWYHEHAWVECEASDPHCPPAATR